MKIVAIHGQNHKGSTYHLAQQFLENITCEKEVTQFFLPKDLNYFCTGCYACIEDEAKCPYHGEKRRIMEAVEGADLLVFATPTYCMAPSAPLKSFLDLTFSYWFAHRPRAVMFRKRAVVLSTAAGGGMGQAIQPVAQTLFYWGVPVVKRYGVSVQAKNWEGVSSEKKAKIARDMKRLGRALSSLKLPAVPIKTKLFFAVFAQMQKAGFGNPVEKEYWEANGWLGRGRPWKS